MSKAGVALVGLGLGVGAILVFASTSKASASSSPASGPKFGPAQTVQGGSGYSWAVAPLLNPGPVGPDVKVFGVFLLQGLPQPGGGPPSPPGALVLTFAQQGSDTTRRNAVSLNPSGAPLTSAAQVDLTMARRDFGV